MWLPILDYADGYGFTYGARISFVDTLGARSRISVPFTWGGEREAALEVDRTFERGPFSRVEGARRRSTGARTRITRSTTRARKRACAPSARSRSWLRVGGGARLDQRATSADSTRRYVAPGVDLIVDTRTRSGVPAQRRPRHGRDRAAALRRRRSTSTRWTSDVRGYVGLFGSSVLALRAAIDPGERRAARRTSRRCSAARRRCAATTSAIAPATTSPPLSAEAARADHVAVEHGAPRREGVRRCRDGLRRRARSCRIRRFDRGIGGGVFMTCGRDPNAGLDVAWPSAAARSKPRWHFGLGVTF